MAEQNSTSEDVADRVEERSNNAAAEVDEMASKLDDLTASAGGASSENEEEDAPDERKRARKRSGAP